MLGYMYFTTIREAVFCFDNDRKAIASVAEYSDHDVFESFYQHRRYRMVVNKHVGSRLIAMLEKYHDDVRLTDIIDNVYYYIEAHAGPYPEDFDFGRLFEYYGVDMFVMIALGSFDRREIPMAHNGHRFDDVGGERPPPFGGRPIEMMVPYGADFDGDAMTFSPDELAHFSNRRNHRVMRSDVGNAPAA